MACRPMLHILSIILFFATCVSSKPAPEDCPPGTNNWNGKKNPDGTCPACGYGFYQPKSGQTDCFMCKPGFTTWYRDSDSEDDCVAEECPKPPLPTSALGWDCSHDYEYNSVCRLKCEPGYQTARTKDGTEGYIQCAGDGSWTGTAECTADFAALIEAFKLLKQELRNLKTIQSGLIEELRIQTGRTDRNVTTPVPITTTSAAQIEPTQRPASDDCPPGTNNWNGKKNPDGTCPACGYGFYQPKYGQTDCLFCPPGYTTWYKDSVSESDCVDKTWTTPTPTTTTTTAAASTAGTPCPSGSISATGTWPRCTPCPPGKEPDASRTHCKWTTGP